MQRSLMIGITERDMQAVINTYDLKPYYYPTLFPLKENYTLTCSTRRKYQQKDPRSYRAYSGRYSEGGY